MESTTAAICLVFLASMPFSVDGTIQCLECSDMPDPYDCNTVTECASNDKCFVSQYVTSSGSILYDMGCMSTYRCQTMKKKKRSLAFAVRHARTTDTDIGTCEECCVGDFCNLQGCGTRHIQQPQRGPICFKCDAQNVQEDCRTTVKCDADEVCMIHKPHAFEPYYSSNCAKEMSCQSISLITDHECVQCCKDDFCNQHCNVTTHH